MNKSHIKVPQPLARKTRKSEILNPKYETNSNDLNNKSKTLGKMSCLEFSYFEILNIV